MKPKLILASASIGRKSLLTKLGIPFDIIPSTIDEDKITDRDLIKMLKLRATAKAENVVKILSSRFPLPASPYLIIAADSMSIVNNKLYGKVKNDKEAIHMIKELMGKTHDFVTATCIILTNQNRELKRWENTTTTRVDLRNLSNEEIKQYTSRYDFTRFAACYAVNETPWDWVTKIDGSYTNVVGLPFEILLPILREVKLIT